MTTLHSPRPAESCSPIAARRLRIVPIAIVILLAGAASTQGAVKDPLKVSSKNVLVATTIPLADGFSTTLTEFITGQRTDREALNLLLGVHKIEGDKRTLVAARDYNADAGGFVSRASLLVIDLDRDGANEILVEYHQEEQPGSTRVLLDVLRFQGGKLVLAWSGPVRVDTTSAALGKPPAERERYVREIDFGATASKQGEALCLTRTVTVAAGAKLDPPRVVKEEVAFGPPAATISAPAPAGDSR